MSMQSIDEEQKPLRTLGEQVALSVATALPFELHILTDEPSVKKLWMNLRTLFRNFHGSYNDRSNIELDTFYDLFVEELEIISELLTSQKIPYTFYLTKCHEDLKHDFPDADVKVPETILQKEYHAMEEYAVIYAKRKVDVKVFARLITAQEKGIVHILTSFPIDLLSHYQFGELVLLESHTGATKTKQDWITKLSKDINHSLLPFNLFIMQILGDRSNLFFSKSPSVKKELMAVATAGKWGPLTSHDKMALDIKNFSSDNKELFLALLKVKLK